MELLSSARRSTEYDAGDREIKLPVPQETDYIKRAPHHQYNLADMLHHVLTGAMHEETCIPGVLTLRDNTGRPVGSNVLAGTEVIIRCARSMLERGNRWKDQFGDVRAGERIGGDGDGMDI